ncbi:MAG: hypothetical protein GTO40_02715 [Deltaproteobacteria bacterium]|nr:hypothetical protein [Deltaproteobacteria bacterium]
MVGPYKKLEPLPVFKNKEFCGSSVPDESLLVNVDGGIENAVVILHGASNHFEKSSRKIVLDNKACRFAPHVQVARLGSEVVLRNSDPILHDVHARLNSNTLFNVGLPTWRQVKRRLTKAGIVKIECEVLHTWMSAFIVVTSSPYFAVTGADGRFSIAGVPVGDYELEVWHERLGRQSKTVTILEGLRSEVNFDFP